MLPLPTPTPQLVIVNESSKLSPTWTWQMAWVLNYQIRWQVAPLLKLMASVTSGERDKLPSGASVLHLVDKLPEAEGALGFHDEDGNELAYARVGVVTTEENGQPVSSVVSHEGIELLRDPHVNLTAFDPNSGKLFPVEECDPVQGFEYDLATPYGRGPVGWIVSDFVLDGYFDPNTKPGAPTNYRGTWDAGASLLGPFSLGSGGYLSFTKTLPPTWEQEFGEHADRRLFENDDRHQRRIAA